MENNNNTIIHLFIKISFKIVFLFYIIFHFMSGKYGYNSYKNFDKNINDKQEILNLQKKNNEKKKNKINKLSNKNLDLDLLEEEIKKNLNITQKNEIIIFSDDF